MTELSYSPDKLKILAKIQHFYDFLVESSCRAGESAITSNNATQNMQDAVLMEAYASMAIEYKQIFSEFIYAGENE